MLPWPILKFGFISRSWPCGGKLCVEIYLVWRPWFWVSGVKLWCKFNFMVLRWGIKSFMMFHALGRAVLWIFKSFVSRCRNLAGHGCEGKSCNGVPHISQVESLQEQKTCWYEKCTESSLLLSGTNHECRQKQIDRLFWSVTIKYPNNKIVCTSTHYFVSLFKVVMVHL